MRNWLFSFFQRGSFVSNDERYFIEPANDGKMNTSAHFRKFHLLFRQATVREGFSNAPSTCGLVGKLTLKIRPACLAKRAKPMFCFCCYRHISRIQEAYLFWRNPIFLIYINDRHDNALLHVVLNHAPYQMGFLTPGSISAKTNKYHLNLGLITWQRKNHKLNCAQPFAWKRVLGLYLLHHGCTKLPVKESTSDLNEIPLRITPQNDLLTPDTLLPCACQRGNAAEMYLISILLSRHHHVARARKARPRNLWRKRDRVQ